MDQVFSKTCLNTRAPTNSGLCEDKIQINKMGAAKRLIDAAIGMTFANADPVAVHVVASAGNQILRDICKREKIESYLRITDLIVPEHIGDFWRCINASANFLKHADRDPDSTHELNQTATEYLILLASKWYRDLTGLSSVEMNVFASWFMLCHPNTILERPDVPSNQDFVATLHQASERVGHMSRVKTLRVGQMLLDLAKQEKT